MSRGNAAVAGVVLIGLIGIALAAIQSPALSRADLPEEEGAVAAVNAAITANPVPQLPKETASVDEICKSLPVISPNASGKFSARASATDAGALNDPCVAKIPVEGATGGQTQCVGKVSVITVDAKGKVSDQWRPDTTVPKGVCRTLACAPKAGGGKTCVQADISGGLDAKKLQALAGSSAAKSAFEITPSGAISGPTTPSQLLDKGFNDLLLGALESEKAELGLNEQGGSLYNPAKDFYDDEGNIITGSVGEDKTLTPSFESEQLKTQTMIDGLKKTFAASQVQPDPRTPPVQNPNAPRYELPPGVGPGSFPSGSGGILPGLLSQLGKALGGGGGLGGGAPQAGNRQPYPPGSCSAQRFCEDGSLYQRDSQCVDRTLQFCPYGCESGQCNPPESVSSTLRAELSCQPKVADVGMTIGMSFSCTSSNGSVHPVASFNTDVEKHCADSSCTSGSAEFVATKLPLGASAQNISLTCASQGQQSQPAVCSIQVGNPAIVMVVNPNEIAAGADANIGWVTVGMQSCTISSPSLPEFNAANAANTSPSGVAKSPALSSDTSFVLSCTTLAGQTKTASTTVSVSE